MKTQARVFLLHIFKLYDLLVMGCSFGAAAIIVQRHNDVFFAHQFLTMRLQILNFLIFLCWLLLWHVIFSSLHLYKSKRVYTKWGREILDVAKAVSLGTIGIMLSGLVFQIEIITLDFVVVFWVLCTVITIASRLMMRYLLRRIRLWGRNLNHVLIVGTNQRAFEIAEKITSKRELGYRFIGFVDDHWHQQDKRWNENDSFVDRLNEIQIYLRDHVVDEVFICVPIKSFYEKISRLIAQCEEQGITTRLVWDAFNTTNGRSQIEQFDDQHVITVDTGMINGEGPITKRLLDILGSMVLLIILAPLFIVVYLLIKTTSPGPAFFVQKRVGLNKRIFQLYKFRTMVDDAEIKLAELEYLNEMSGPVFKISSDPRITPVGSILRQTSVDELPQLINVLKGDMSLVGPRPLPMRDYGGFEQDWHRRRLSIKPGITCLWQVEGRNSIPFEKWMELDLQYIDHWSIWLDLKILFKTIPAVVKGNGAS